jgi:hypothetical protein
MKMKNNDVNILSFGSNGLVSDEIRKISKNCERREIELRIYDYLGGGFALNVNDDKTKVNVLEESWKFIFLDTCFNDKIAEQVIKIYKKLPNKDSIIATYFCCYDGHIGRKARDAGFFYIDEIVKR